MLTELPQKIEIVSNLPENNDTYRIELKDLMKDVEGNDVISPSDLARLFIKDYPKFLKEFINYITSEEMKAKVGAAGKGDGFDRVKFEQQMKKYFISYNEIPANGESIDDIELFFPLKLGLEELFQEGMQSPEFKQEIKTTLKTQFNYNKKTDKFDEKLVGSDVGNNFTGLILKKYRELYNKGFVAVEKKELRP